MLPPPAPRRALLVEPDPVLRSRLAEVLRARRFDVMAAPGREEALQALRSARFALVIHVEREAWAPWVEQVVSDGLLGEARRLGLPNPPLTIPADGGGRAHALVRREQLRRALVRALDHDPAAPDAPLTDAAGEDAGDALAPRGGRAATRTLSDGLIQAALAGIGNLQQQVVDALEGISDALLLASPQEVITFANARAQELLAQPLAALQGRSLWTALPFLSVELRTRVQRAHVTLQPLEEEVHVPSQQAVLGIRFAPSPRGLMVSFQDLTTRRAADAVLQRSSDRLRLAAEVAGLGTWEQPDGAEAVVLCPHARGLLGLGEGAEGPVALADLLARIHPLDVPLAQALWGRGPWAEVPAEAVLRVIAPGGEAQRVEVHAQSRGSAAGVWRLGTIGRERGSGSVVSADPRRAALLHGLPALLVDVLKAPLAEIELEVQRSTAAGGAGTEALERIRQATRRQAELTRALAEHVELQLGPGVALRQEPFDLQQLIRLVAEEQELEAGDRALALVQEGEGLGHADPGRLGRALAELFAFALRRLPPGETLQVRSAVESASLRLTLSGTTSSAEAEATVRALEAPHAAPTPELLGLAVAVALLEAHGATLQGRLLQPGQFELALTLPRG